LMRGAGGKKRNKESDLCKRTQHNASDVLMRGWRIQLVRLLQIQSHKI
jgi:hypothetical protein